MGRGGEEVHILFWWENLRKRDHLEDLGVGVIMILKSIFKE